MKTNISEKSASFFSLLSFWKSDLQAGFIVSLLALPMSLGVALASGFPPFAGIITAIVAGVIISFLSGSSLAIKGPAGGLSAIMLIATLQLGNGNLELGYRIALAVVVVSGVVQLIFGVARLGNIADFFPASTIHGMLAALGISMSLKQIHLAIGVQPISAKPWDLFLEIPSSLNSLNPKIALVALLAIGIMVAHHFLTSKYVKAIPSAIFVLIFTIPMGLLWDLNIAHNYTFAKNNYVIDPSFSMLNIPNSFMETIVFPDFSHVLDFNFWENVVMLSFACTIESLLSTKGIDKLDPEKRNSNQNKDLFAIGIGNIISGFVGGLPMISESKRSVVNIDNGGKSIWSGVFHGGFLLLFIAFGSKIINLIPYAALAAILVFTGTRMVTPAEFSKSYKIGAEQFLVFFTTFVLSLAFNFMVGIACGVLVELIIHLVFGVSFGKLFKGDMRLLKGKDNNFEVVFAGPAVFSNYLNVRKVIQNIPTSSHITFDFSKATIVDHTFMEHLQAFEQRRADKGGTLAIAGLDYHKHLSDHPLASKRIVKQKQLSERQIQLQNFALMRGYAFDHRMVSNMAKFSGLSLSEGNQIKVEENSIGADFKRFKWQISDISVEQSGNTAIKQGHKITVCHVRNISSQIPDFTIQKEGFFDSLFNLSGMNDIDFEDFPNFSYYYLLKGPNENQIRNFFKFELVQFFEQHKGFNVECKSGSVTIYKKQSLLTIEEIEQMLKFSEHLITTIMLKLKIEAGEG